MTCAGFIEPLNLQCLLQNVFAGSSLIFTIIMTLFISVLAGRFKMPNYVFLASLALYGVIMSLYITQEIYLLIILLVGLGVFQLTTKIWRRE